MERFVLFCTERRIWNDVITTSLIICMIHVHAAKLLDLSHCQQDGTWTWPMATLNYPCGGSLASKALFMSRNAHVLWQGIWRLTGPEMYLMWCVCASLAWFASAVLSMHSATVKQFYASGARVVLIVCTKFACKIVSIVTLALWRDTQLSTFCRWYLPVDGAVLLCQAHVAPVGAAAQATIAAADAACTFCCCWLLSDRWPYNFSTGTVLTVNLLLASASLWLAERMEQSYLREYERAAAMVTRPGGLAGARGKPSEASLAVARKSTVRVLPPTAAAAGTTCRCCVARCECGCGHEGAANSIDGSAAVNGGDGGRTHNVIGGPMDAKAATGATSAAPAPTSSLQLQQEEQQWQDDGQGSLDMCCCLSRRPGTYSDSLVASGTGGAARPSAGPCGGSGGGCGLCIADSGGGGGGGTITLCSEASSPGTLSSTRSLSRALPSFGTLSNNSAFGIFAGGSCTPALVLTENGCSSRTESCPSSYICGQIAVHQQQPAPARALAAAAPPPLGQGLSNADRGGDAPASGAVAVAAAATRHARPSQSCCCTFTPASATACGSADRVIAIAGAAVPAAPLSVSMSEAAGLPPEPPLLAPARGGGPALNEGALDGHLAYMAPTSVQLEGSLLVRAALEPDASGSAMTAALLRASGGQEACTGELRNGGRGPRGGGGGGDASRVSVSPPLPPASTQVSSGGGDISAALHQEGPDPLRQLRCLVHNLIMRSGPSAVASTTAPAAAPSSGGQHLPIRKPCSRGANTNGVTPTSAAISFSRNHISEPCPCSDQSQEIAMAAAATPLNSSNSIQRQAAIPATGKVAAQNCGCCTAGSAAGARLGVSLPIPTLPHATTTIEALGCSPAGEAPIYMLVSADAALTHPQLPVVTTAGVAVVVSVERGQPCGVVSDIVTADGGLSGCADAPASVVVDGCGKGTIAPLVSSNVMPGAAMAPQAHLSRAALSADRSAMGDAGAADGNVSGMGLSSARADIPAFGDIAVESMNTPRSFALARALAARGGNNAMYDMPALRHGRCNVKLGALTPSDLPYGFVNRVATLLAAAGGSATGVAALAGHHPAVAAPALATVGVYVREGCVEIVADILVPSDAAATESSVVAMAANTSVSTRSYAGSSAAGTADGSLAVQLRRLLPLDEDAAATSAQQHQQHQRQMHTESAAIRHPDSAAAEAMLGLMERCLLPQIYQALSPLASGSAATAAAPPPSIIGGVRMQAAVGAIQMEASRPAQLATTAALIPLPQAARTPPPTIACVTPCCIALNQFCGDETRDRRRPTLTLTVALAGIDASAGMARLPRMYVRHSGRCLAAVVLPSTSAYVGCMAVTVELAIPGIRPGLLFLEVEATAADDTGAASHGDGSLSLPWPVLVVSDVRVAAEMMQMQQHLEATAPLRALHADAGLLPLRQQRAGSSNTRAITSIVDSSPQPQQQQRQHVYCGTTSLLLDFGMWLDAVSMPDAAVIAAATGRPFVGVGDAAAAAAARGRHAPSYASTAAAQPPTPLAAGPSAQDTEEEEGSDDDGSWASSEEQSSGSATHNKRAAMPRVDLSSGRTVRPPGQLLQTRSMCGGGGSSACADGKNDGLGASFADCADAADGADDGEVQMLLLRGLQPEQELLEGSLDCAAEYEQTCRQGIALQSAAVGLGMRLLHFAVLRGWPAAATLVLKGLMVHCRLGFEEVRLLFPAAATAATAPGGGLPLLHTAVMSGNLAMVRTVKAWAQHYRCSLPWDEPVAAVGGLTPLHLVAVQEGGRLAGAILGLWPDAEALWAVVQDSDGRTPLQYAHIRTLGRYSSSRESTSVLAKPLLGLPVTVSQAPATTPTAAIGLVTALTPPPPTPPPQKRQQMLRGFKLQPSHRQEWAQLPPPPPQEQLGAAGAAAAPGWPLVMGLAPRAQQPLPLQTELGACNGGGGGGSGAAAASIGEGPGSCVSSVLMSATVQGVHGPGHAVGRSDRTSDCGSMSVGPESQWSHSTATTAQTQLNFQPTRTLQDLRSPVSPVKAANVLHSINATLLSLANLPDMSSNTGNPSVTVTAALAAAQQQQHQLQPQSASSRPVCASFQLDLAGQKARSLSPQLTQLQLHSNPEAHPFSDPPGALPSLQHPVLLPPPLPLPPSQQQRQADDGVRGLQGSSYGTLSTQMPSGARPAAGAPPPPPSSGACGDSGVLVDCSGMPSTASVMSREVTAMAATTAAAEAGATSPLLPPSAVEATHVRAAKPPRQHCSHPHRAMVASATPAVAPNHSRYSFSSRGVRILATSFIGDAATSAALLPMRSPPGSTGSRSFATTAASSGVAGAGDSPQSTTSAASTLSLSATITRSVAFNEGHFSPNSRRAAFADDYAPFCQPTVAARISRLRSLLPVVAKLGGRANGRQCYRATVLRLELEQQQQQEQQQLARLDASGPEVELGLDETGACAGMGSGGVGSSGSGGSGSFSGGGGASKICSPHYHHPAPVVVPCGVGGTTARDGEGRLGSNAAAPLVQSSPCSQQQQQQQQGQQQQQQGQQQQQQEQEQQERVGQMYAGTNQSPSPLSSPSLSTALPVKLALEGTAETQTTAKLMDMSAAPAWLLHRNLLLAGMLVLVAAVVFPAVLKLGR